MCTVSYVPNKGKAFLTSNRDEHVSRQTDYIVQEKNVAGQRISFPKDKKAGGTWFAVKENGSAIVLLNGAFKNHDRKPPYAKSRGLIVLETIAMADPIAYLTTVELENIEPFTLVIYHQNNLWEFRWDGHQKHMEEKDSDRAHIWSSATLYNEQAAQTRELLFREFIAEHAIVDDNMVLTFHQTNHGDYENGFVIDRQNGLKTLSVTQAIIEEKELTISHLDLPSKSAQRINLSPVAPVETLP